jgi:hypothetical protein
MRATKFAARGVSPLEWPWSPAARAIIRKVLAELDDSVGTVGVLVSVVLVQKAVHGGFPPGDLAKDATHQ